MMMMTTTTTTIQTTMPPRADDENARKRFYYFSSRFSHNCCHNISTQPTSVTPNNAWFPMKRFRKRFPSQQQLSLVVVV
jgi:hypothetical protein